MTPTCSTCNEKFPGLKVNSQSECLRCSRDKQVPKMYSAENNMHPGPTPTELQVSVLKLYLAIITKQFPPQGLTQVEEMLISAVMPVMSIYRLPHGQYGYKGHIINLPQDVSAFATSLPRLPSELDIVLVRKEGTHHDFRVRKLVVLRALKWLKQHNKYYRNIEINLDALNLLPDDGELPGKYGLTVSHDKVEEEEEEEEELSDDKDPHDASTFVPGVARKLTEQENIRKSISERQSEPTIPWPEKGDAPINEFNTEGYISCAFPTLLPTGAADFLAPRAVQSHRGELFQTPAHIWEWTVCTGVLCQITALKVVKKWTLTVQIVSHPLMKMM